MPDHRHTNDELDVLEHLAEAFNVFSGMTEYHPDDATEFRRAIHAAQNIVASRLAKRVAPGVYGTPD